MKSAFFCLANAQIKRISAQSEQAGLAVETIWAGANPWHGIPLEEMSWFLRSLRPRDEKAQAKLAEYRSAAVWTAIEYWVTHRDAYTERQTAQKLLRNPDGERERPYRPKPPSRKGVSSSRIFLEDVTEMKRLAGEGVSMADIARRFDVSRTTVSLCVNDKYPVNLRPRPTQDTKNSRPINQA